MDSGFGNDVGVQAVAEIDGVDVVAGAKLACASREHQPRSECLYQIGARLPVKAETVHSPLKIAIHDGEEDLEKQVDGIYQHRQQVQPRLASHCEKV